MSLETLIADLGKSETSEVLEDLLASCQVKGKGNWVKFFLNNVELLPEFLDLAPAIELGFLLRAKEHGFSVCCEEFEADFDLTESTYFRNQENLDEHINTIHIFDPNYTAPRAAITTDNFILKGIVEMLQNGIAPLEERQAFNALLEMCIVEVDWVHDYCTSWSVRLMVPSLDDARVIKERFSGYIQTALSEADDFWSLQIWIGSGDTAVWYDRVSIASIKQ